MSQANMNRTPLWDRTGHVPTPFAKQMSQPSRVSRIEGFFYKKLQYNGSADLDKVNKTQPNPKTMDFLGRGSHQELERYTPGAPGEGAHVEETT
jgi:hypothetical protein